MAKYYVKITDIDKTDFSFYGNECTYTVDVFNHNKIKIGEAVGVNVVQQGTDYESVYEELANLCEDEDKDAIASYLGVEEVPDEWFDEEGMIDVDKLPQSVSDYIYEGEDQIFLDYYMYEEFANEADDNGLIPLEIFRDSLTFGVVGNFRKMNTDQPFTTMFSEIGGWYYPVEFIPTEEFVPFDITTNDGKTVFVKLAAIIAHHLEDCDYVSSMVDIRYDGDEAREEEAQKVMNYACVEIAYVILRSLLPQIGNCTEQEWTKALNTTITNIGRRLGFIYGDEEASIDQLCDEVYIGLNKHQWQSSTHKEEVSNQLVSALMKKGTYPMTDKKYSELKDDRNILFLDYAIG